MSRPWSTTAWHSRGAAAAARVAVATARSPARRQGQGRTTEMTRGRRRVVEVVGGVAASRSDRALAVVGRAAAARASQAVVIEVEIEIERMARNPLPPPRRMQLQMLMRRQQHQQQQRQQRRCQRSLRRAAIEVMSGCHRRLCWQLARERPGRRSSTDTVHSYLVYIDLGLHSYHIISYPLLSAAVQEDTYPVHCSHHHSHHYTVHSPPPPPPLSSTAAARPRPSSSRLCGGACSCCRSKPCVRAQPTGQQRKDPAQSK
jgi:hypothetical protein